MKMAAENNDLTAQVTLGLMYREGNGTDKSPVKSLEWYRKAAERGQAEAQFLLGSFYSTGDDTGLPLDYVQAYMWLLLSGKKNPKPFGELYEALNSSLTSVMTPLQIEEAQRLAREWKLKKE